MAPKQDKPELPVSDPQQECITNQFLRASPYFIRVDLHASHYNEAQPHRFLEHVASSLEDLCDDLVYKIKKLVISHWSAPFAFSLDESRSAQRLSQDRCTLLAGIRPPRAEQSVPEDDLDAIKHAVNDWEEKIRESDVWKDERYPPSLYAIVTEARYAQDLVLDTITHPEFTSLTSTIFTNIDNYDDMESEYTAVPSYAVEKPLESSPERKAKLRPAADILKRLRWDFPAFDSSDFTIIYEDRFTAFKEVPIKSFAKDSTDESFVPEHRIAAFRNVRTGQVVWHKEKRLDLISGTGAERSAVNTMPSVEDEV